MGLIANINQAEVYAISRLCNNEVWIDRVEETIYIYSDSQSAIEAIGSNLAKSKTVFKCK